MNKYNQTTVDIDGVPHDRGKVVFRPKVDSQGNYRTHDGKRHHVDANGTVRKIKE